MAVRTARLPPRGSMPSTAAWAAEGLAGLASPSQGTTDPPVVLYSCQLWLERLFPTANLSEGHSQLRLGEFSAVLRTGASCNHDKASHRI